MGMTHALLPLAALTMLPVMLRIDRGLLSAAGTLGAPRTQIFWRVLFHLSIPGVAASGLWVFIASLGFFITPALLGGGPHVGDDRPGHHRTDLRQFWTGNSAERSPPC